MVKLYIENQFIELDNEVQFAITKTFEDITNPTSIINDWSKTVSIPFTDSNNEIFGHIYNPDRLTLHTSDESLTTGLYFDPLKKLNFRLEWDSMLLMQGYAKMTSITKSNGKGRYNVTLNGELGKIFQEMKKITFDETAYTGEDKDKYWIDGSIYVKETLNKELIKTCFETEPVSLELYNKNHYKYKVTDIIGFTVNNSKIPDFFKYDSCEYESYKSKQFTTILDEKEWTSSTGEVFKEFLLQTGVEPSTVIESGLLPRQVGEFRSYLQLPFIYFNKLFQIFTKKVEDLTDYKCTFDDNWFNGENPYWNNLVYMLAPFYDEGSESEEVYSNFINDDILTNAFGVYDYGDAKILTNSRNNWELVDGSNILNSSKQMFINHGAEYEFEVNLNNMQIATLNGGYVKCKINPKQTFFVDLVFTPNDSTGIQETIPLFAIMDDSANFSYDGYETIKIGDLTDNYTQNDKKYFSSTFNLAKVVRTHKFIKNTENGYFNVWISVRHLPVNQSYTMYRFERENEHGTISTSNQETLIKLNTKENTNILNLKYKVKNIQSTYNFNLNTLWNKKYNLFSEILKYCKMYKILIKIDNSNKTINFVQFNKYFQNFTIEDWSSKLDLSKDFIIKPITFENKYVLFNYDDFDSDLYKEYKELFGFGYGEYKLTTEYNFNSEEKKLFEGIKPSIIYTPNILSWQTLYDCKIEYYVPYEKYIYNSDAEGKNTDVFGSMFFYNGIQNFDAELGDVYISDDTEFQKTVSEFMYITFSSSDKVKVSKFPKLDIVSKNNLSTFGTPLLNYTLDSTSYDNKTNLFTNFWKNYLDERYNTNNKIVTCYLDITPIDYYNFDFNKFIKIDNQLYFVNKIYDYDITSNSTTKVDLITIQDLNGYTKNNYNFSVLELFNQQGEAWDNTSDYIHIDGTGSETIYISSSSDVNWSFINLPTNFSQSELAKISVNGETISGTIQAGIKVPINIKNNGTDLNATILFENQQGFSVSVNIRTFFKEMQFFNSNNNVIYEYDILLENVGQTKTIYMTANTPVDWRDVNSSLSGVQVYYNNNTSTGAYQEGTIPAGTKVPITFKMVDSTTQSGAIEFTNGIESFTVDVQKELNTKFTVYDTDKTEYDTSDKVILQNTSPLTKTIYITSPNVAVSWNDNGTNLQDLTINGVAGSGTIPKGTLVPVTLTMDVGDNKPKDMPVYGKIKFYTPQKTVIIDIMLIWNRIFDIYRWDGVRWKENFDYIELTQAEPIKTIYLSANDDVEWSDVSGDLQNLYLSTEQDEEDWGGYENGSGTIYPPSNMKPVHFRMYLTTQQGTDSGKVSFFDGAYEWFIDVVLNGNPVSDEQSMSIYTKDNKLVEDWETLTLAGQETQSLTVYVTSNTDVNVQIHQYAGSLTDVQINGVDASELYQGYDTVTLKAGTKVPLTISTVWGGDDFNLEMYLRNGSVDRVFYVDCVW